MTCDSVIRQLPLYLYGELSFDREEAVARHLEECPVCTVALERERRLQDVMDRFEERPPATLLERCRMDLPRTLRQSAMAQPASGLAARFWLAVGSPTFPMGGWWRPVGAVALVALGFFAARVSEDGTGAGMLSRAGLGGSSDAVATQVRLVEPTDGGAVRIVVDETRQRVLSGSVEDERISGLLLRAVRNPSDPGVRAESLDLLKKRQQCDEVKHALLYALEHDPNDGVRLKALEGLRSYSRDHDSRRVLSRVLLNDDNPGIRSQAIDLLVGTDEIDVVETLQELLRREENGYLRLRTEQALQDMNASVETF